jgi:phosphomannomutase
LSKTKIIYFCNNKKRNVALIKSISGIRGTIGGAPDDGLTPVDIVKYASAFGSMVVEKTNNKKIVIGRDGRISGEMVRNLVCSTLQAMGIDVIDLGLSTTPTVEMAVTMEKAGGGIILTASHNPAQWNALKLLNEKGEFISGAEGEEVLRRGNTSDFIYADVYSLGKITHDDTYMQKYADIICKHPLVNVNAITEKNFTIVLDGINSTGSIFVPHLLKSLGVKNIHVVNAEVNGQFAHNPEPLPEHLTEICSDIINKKADLGIVVDPDVDRLCFINEDGSFFGEEYTLVAIADYILTHKKGNTVSNLSSTRALRDVTEKHGGIYKASAVGEVNVVNMMREIDAVIGGEGNGGIIIPELHYGRDALIGIALFLSHLATSNKTISELKATYPSYFISKNKIDLPKGTTLDVIKANIFAPLKEKYKAQPINDIDGLKIEFDKEWVHLRTSNTEPIIRVYSESKDEVTANALAHKLMDEIKALM